MEMIDLTEIERQHQKLTNMLGRLSDAAKNHEPRDVVYRIIDDDFVKPLNLLPQRRR